MIILENYDLARGAAILKKYIIVTVCMIVIIATAVVPVFLHNETDRNAQRNIWFSFKLGFFYEIGKKVDILDWEWGRISDPGDREKRPWPCIEIDKPLVVYIYI